jgi:putative ABC transport system permease protein
VDVARTMLVTLRPEARVASVEDQRAAMQAVLDIVHELPGVRSAATAREDPFRSGHAIAPWSDATPLERVIQPDEEVPYVTPVGVGFFGATGRPMLAGRDFSAEDGPTAPRVAILNATLARQLFPGGIAVGQCVYLTDAPACVRVVGVVSGAWKGRALRRDARAVYVPESQGQFVGAPVANVPTVALVAVEQPSALESVQRALADHLRRVSEPRLAAFAVRFETLDEMLDPEIHAFRATAAVATGLALCVVAVAWFGLWSATSRTMALRRRDVAVRRALGATAWVAAREANGRVLLALSAGSAGALVVLMWSARWLDQAFYMASVANAPTLIAALAVPLAMGVGAAFIAWRKAAAADPGTLLKLE